MERKTKFRKCLETLVVAGATSLATAFGGMANRAEGAVYGFTSLKPSSLVVNSGDTIRLDFYQGSYTNAGSGLYQFKIGSVASDTNFINPTGEIDFYIDSSNNITNGFYAGKVLAPGSSGIVDLGNGLFRVNLALDGGYTGKNTNNAFSVYLQANNPGTDALQIAITETLATLASPSGESWGNLKAYGRTWSLTNSIPESQGGNPNPYTTITIMPAPQQVPIDADINLTGIRPYFPGFSGPTNCFIIDYSATNVETFSLETTTNLADSNSWRVASLNETGATNWDQAVNGSVTNYTTDNMAFYRAHVVTQVEDYLLVYPTGSTTTSDTNTTINPPGIIIHDPKRDHKPKPEHHPKHGPEHGKK